MNGNNPVNFEELKAAVLKNNSHADIPFIKSAFDFASEVHKNQTRDGGDPYIGHPFRVAVYLAEVRGIGDPAIIAAALLHDVIEDGPQVTEKVLEDKFGQQVAGYVAILTKNKVPGLDKSEVRRRYYEKLRQAPPEVIKIKVADRLDNIRFLHNNPYKKKINRYVLETRDIYLPLAREHFPCIADEMRKILNNYDKDGNPVFNSYF